METKEFIEDAINGGWGVHIGKKWRISASYIEHMQTYWGRGQWDKVMPISKALLDPLAWQAVGFTRMWEDVEGYDMEGNYSEMEGWKDNWHHFITHLADGKTIEEALLALK